VGFALGLGHDVFDFLDAAEDGAEGDELAAGKAGDDAGESGFAATRGAPEKHGAEIVGLDLEAKGFAGAEKFFLADEFVEGAGTHAFGERLQGGGGVVVGAAEGGEKAHGSSLAQQGGYQRSGRKRNLTQRRRERREGKPRTQVEKRTWGARGKTKFEKRKWKIGVRYYNLAAIPPLRAA